MGKKYPLVSIITVNYNGRHFLKDCFDSLFALNYPKDKIEIIMVDNCSTDGSVDFVKEQYPRVALLQNDVNNYARANNLGIKTAKGEFIALINNDVKVDENWLSALIKTAQNDESIGAVGSKILFMDGSIQSVGHQEYPNYYWGDIGFREEDKGQYNIEKEVISICGCSVLYREKCLKDVGFLDEDFNMYMEDVDMAIRCRNKGWKLLTCPDSIIRHEYHGTIKNDDNSFFWVETNRLLLIAKHWPEKLADALSGKDYFTVKNSYSNVKDIGEVIGKVFCKLLKEHGYDVLNKLSSRLFEAIRIIYNFEKNYLIQNAMNERDGKNNSIIELNMLKKENLKLEEDLSFLRIQKDQEISSLQQQKESELASLEQQKNQELASLQQQKETELASLEQQKNQEISSLQQKKDQEIASLMQQKDSELDAYKLNLQLTKKKLNEIYSSTGYRYLLKPLWDFLWPKKQKFRQLYVKIKNLPDRLKFEFKNKIIIKLTEIYYSLSFRKEAAGVYLNHIKYKTFPLLAKRLTLMIIRRCNLKCRFCDIADVDHRKEILPKEDAFKIIDETNKLGIEEIILTGGEPFLHPDIFEIIDFINLRKIKITITTNGLFIKQNIEKIVNSDIDCISVSIDGKEKTHDLLRNHKGAYREAMEAIQILKGNKINTSVNFVVTNMNIYELKEVYGYFHDLGIKVSFLPVINKPDLFPSKKEERIVYTRFIKKLLHQRRISIYEYKYLKTAIEVQFKRNNIYSRCLGLNFELGVDTDANISPCCVWENRKPDLNNLGNILKENIEELWHSPQFHKARVSIFRKGCQDCFNPSIVDLSKIAGINFFLPVEKTNEGNIAPGIKIKEAAIRKPAHVHMRFTSRCNLTCRHCDIWKIDKFQKCEISVEEWIKNIDKLHSWLGGFKLDLAGGEMLLYNGTIPLIKYCASKDITVNLTTNSTLIDEAMAEKITNCGLYCINLSLDGLQDSHCYTRNNSSSFLKVHKAAQNLLKYRKQGMPYISLTTVITKYNLKQLLEVVNLTKEWGINNISFQALDQNFGAKYCSDWFKNNEFWPKNFTETEEAIDNLIRMKKSGVRIDNSFSQLNAFKRYYNDPIKEINKQCFSGFNNFIVNEFGEVLLCWNMSPVGNLLSDNPEQIWNGKSAIQMRKQIEKCERTCRILNCNYV